MNKVLTLIFINVKMAKGVDIMIKN